MKVGLDWTFSLSISTIGWDPSLNLGKYFGWKCFCMSPIVRIEFKNDGNFSRVAVIPVVSSDVRPEGLAKEVVE